MDNYERIADLIEQGRKIEAIKLLREATGIGLAEAKAQIEQLSEEAAGQAVPGAASGLPEDILALANAGKKIEAIKLLRERTGLGLNEAKERVEAETGPVNPAGSHVLVIGIALLLLGAAIVVFMMGA